MPKGARNLVRQNMSLPAIDIVDMVEEQYGVRPTTNWVYTVRWDIRKKEEDVIEQEKQEPIKTRLPKRMSEVDSEGIAEVAKRGGLQKTLQELTQYNEEMEEMCNNMRAASQLVRSVGVDKAIDYIEAADKLLAK